MEEELGGSRIISSVFFKRLFYSLFLECLYQRLFKFISRVVIYWEKEERDMNKAYIGHANLRSSSSDTGLHCPGECVTKTTALSI